MGPAPFQARDAKLFKKETAMATADRISPQEAREHMQSEPEALLVCAYDSDEKFQQNRLDGAMSLSQFKAQADKLPKDSEIIFY
jgi:hypothetical protein